MPRQQPVRTTQIPPNPFDAPSQKSGLAGTPRGFERPTPMPNTTPQRSQRPTSIPRTPVQEHTGSPEPIRKNKAKKAKASKQKVVPQKSIQQQAKQRKASNKKNKVQKEGTLFQRIKFFIQTHSVGEMIQIFCEWFDEKYYISIVVAVLGILIGLLFNRYISIGVAFVLVLFGVILSRKNLDKGEYACYLSGFIAFLIPYLF